MRRLAWLAPCWLLASPASARPPAPGDLAAVTLDRTRPAVDATIAGVPTRLAVTFDEGVYLAPTLADRLGVAWQPGAAEYVGRVRVRHREASGIVSIAGIDAPMRLQTQDAPCCGDREGAIGVSDLPWPIVRIGQAGPTNGVDGERRYRVTQDAESGLSIPWRVGHETIHVLLSPDAPETVATASAAAILSRAYGGRLGTAVRQVVVAYDIARSVRDMTLGRRASLLGLPLDRIAVRMGDYAGDTELPQPESPAATGGDEIVVRHRPAPPQFRWAAITVGRDLLGRCSQISLYRRERQIGLVCDPMPAARP